MLKRKNAIALGYKMGKDDAPKILAKGQGLVAEKIIAMAQENNIPVHNNPDLVQQLALLDLGDTIPEELYQVVAEILIFVDGLVDERGGKR